MVTPILVVEPGVAALRVRIRGWGESLWLVPDEVVAEELSKDGFNRGLVWTVEETVGLPPPFTWLTQLVWFS